jgi:hypothetical protein
VNTRTSTISAPALILLAGYLRSFGHDDVEVTRGAVSDHNNGTMNFAPDHADGGRLAPNGQEEVKVVRMRDWLNEPIDLLKLDIEGAEFDVIKDCDDRLSIVKCLFVEYHSLASQRSEGRQQHDLDQLYQDSPGSGISMQNRSGTSLDRCLGRLKNRGAQGA